jgi:hypothetical protein
LDESSLSSYNTNLPLHPSYHRNLKRLSRSDTLEASISD